MNMQRFFKKTIKKVNKLSGGVTNEIFKVQCEDSKNYIFRKYGKKSSAVIERENDVNILKYVNQYSIGPKIIDEFENGRIESYEEGQVIKDFNKYQVEICNTMQNLHDIPIRDDIIHIYDRLYDWSKRIGKPNSYKIDHIIEKLKDNNFLNENVLGHGDLSIGNILIDKNKVKLIDFEYSCILPRGFDIANHLCEYNGVNDIKYPDKEIRKQLIKIYLNNYNIEYNDNYLKIVDMYAIISSYYWGCWGMIYDCDIQSIFDYNEYSNKRFNLFLELYKNL